MNVVSHTPCNPQPNTTAPRARFFLLLGCLAFLLGDGTPFSLPVSQAEETKPSVKSWQIKGTAAVFKDKNRQVWMEAIRNETAMRVLAFSGQASREIAPAVAKLLTDSDSNVREVAAEAWSRWAQLEEKKLFLYWVWPMNTKVMLRNSGSLLICLEAGRKMSRS